MRIGINAQLLAFSETYRQAGLSRYIYELVTRIPRLDGANRYLAFVGNAPLPSDVARAKPANLVFSQSLLPTERAPARIAWEQAALPLATWRKHLDLLHCPVNVRPLWGACPTIITVHDLIFLRYPENFQPTKRRYLAAMTRWSSQHADCVIAVSEATRRDVIDLLEVHPNRVVTIHNGVGKQFKPAHAEEIAGFRTRKGIEGRIIFYVGTLEPRKNLVTLIKAFGSLASQPGYEDVSLAIGGSKGWFYDEIFKAAERIGPAAAARVRFLGRVPDEDLPLWYNVAAVFAYPSLYEGFGLPALEAMACGVPVITSNTSSFPEVVRDGGIMLRPLDTKAWSETMRGLLDDPARSRELSEAGLKQAQHFSWERTAAETVAVYRQVLSQSKPAV